MSVKPEQIAVRLAVVAGCLLLSACGGAMSPKDEALLSGTSEQRVSAALLQQRSDAIKAIHAAHASIHNPLIFAGIAYAETEMAHCYSEYYSQVSSLVCPGPASSDCGGGAVAAGYWDGPCGDQVGGIGMFQFDEGNYTQTLNKWNTSGYWNSQPRDILDVEGNIAAAIDFVLFKAWYSSYTPYFSSYQAMYNWINGIRPVNGDANWELWLGFLANSYNGKAWGSADWSAIKEAYRADTLYVYNAMGGNGYWYSTTTAPALPTNTKATALDSSRIQFSWTESSNQTGFVVTDGVTQVTLGAAARSYTWTGLAPNTYKCSSVRAYNSVGSSAWTSWACTATLAAVQIPLPVAYISQYQGQASQNVDCGPADVAMVVQYRGLRPSGLTDNAFVSQVRSWTGVGDNVSYTTFTHLENALTHYGLTWSEIAASLTPAPDAQVLAMRTATNAGKTVIALVHGADLGRGAAYGDHWVLVRGFTSDGQTVYLNDPDNQAARWIGWIVGGQITLPVSTFRTALYNAAPGPYGITIN